MVTTGELRPGLALAAGAATLAVVLAGVIPFREELDRAVPALGLVVPVLVTAAIGGSGPALVMALAGAVALNVCFLVPYGTVRIPVWEDVVALGVFASVATGVGTLSRGIGRRRLSAARDAVAMEEMRADLQTARDERELLAREAARLRPLEENEDQRSAVLRSVSHDLRTPLATILSVTSDLRSGTDYDDATRNELLDIVGDEAQRLDRLVSNLLSMSRLEAGALSPRRQAVDLEELTRDRVGRLARLFHQVRLVVDIPEDLPLVDGDYSQLDQLVTNLLENAARYAPPRSTLTISAAARDEGAVQLSIQDEGIGVPDYERALIFDPFRKGTESRSSGVGLAICKGIVAGHGGRIWVDRTPGGGATFFVTLPVRKVRPGG